MTQFVNSCPITAGDLIMLGDFNCIPNNAELTSRGYSNIFNVGEYTNSTLSETYDNILMPHKLHPRCVHHGICQNSLGISNHLPIWANFLC